MSKGLVNALFVGVDLGTSGVRAVAMDHGGNRVAQARQPLPAPERDGARLTQDPALWWAAAQAVLALLCAQVHAHKQRIHQALAHERPCAACALAP